MAQIQVVTYRLTSVDPLSFILVSPDTPPPKRYEVKTVDDCKRALKQYAEEMTQTTRVPLLLSVLFVRNSGRKPAGFDKAERELKCHVNAELLTADAAA